jgi:hypothetical protein
MAKVKNVSGHDLHDGYAGRLVLAGQVVDVPDEVLWNYTQRAPGQTGLNWDPADEKSKKLHDKAAAEHFPADNPEES